MQDGKSTDSESIRRKFACFEAKIVVIVDYVIWKELE